MVWKCVHGVTPVYLSDLCIPATAISGRQHLRSAATGIFYYFHVPGLPLDNKVLQSTTSHTHGTVCHQHYVRAQHLLERAFKRALKMHLFSSTRRH